MGWRLRGAWCPGGCGQDPEALERTLLAADLDRTFELTLPDDYDPSRAYPLVFAWHASRGDGSLARLYFGLDDVVGDEGIIVDPNALPLEDGETGWDLTEDGRDVAFFDALGVWTMAGTLPSETKFLHRLFQSLALGSGG